MEILFGLAGAIVGALVVKGAEILYWSQKERRASWQGEWLATLQAVGTRPLRKDRWIFHQRGNTVYAKIYREEGPPEEIGYVWDFVGKERESELFGVYETKDPNSKSYGGIMFSHTASHQYDGFYFRLENGEIAKVSISLKRV